MSIKQALLFTIDKLTSGSSLEGKATKLSTLRLSTSGRSLKPSIYFRVRSYVAVNFYLRIALNSWCLSQDKPAALTSYEHLGVRLCLCKLKRLPTARCTTAWDSKKSQQEDCYLVFVNPENRMGTNELSNTVNQEIHVCI